MIGCMNSVAEIEKALRQLPPEERWEIARWLLDDLQENTLSQAQGDQGAPTPPTPPLPDYSARRRRIFGNKVLPNMVLASRADERF